MAVGYTASNGDGAGGTTSVSFAVDNTGGNAMFAIAGIEWFGITATSITFNGVSLTLVANTTHSTFYGYAGGYLLNAAGSSQTLQINMSGSADYLILGGAGVSGADTAAVDDTDHNNSTSGGSLTTPSLTLTSQTDGMVFAGIASQNEDQFSDTAGNSMTNRLSYAESNGYVRISTRPGAASATVGFTENFNGARNGMVAVAFKPAGGGTQSYSYTATGGLSLSGASPALRARTKSAAGGLMLAGAATVIRKCTSAATGGLQLGGAASFAKGMTVTVSGGVQIAGVSTEIRVRVVAPSGGLNLGGSADYSSSGTQTYSYTATGGMVLGGAASIAAAKAVLAAGGLNLGGVASLSFHESTRTVSAAGGLQMGGAAGFSTFNAGQVGSDWLIRKRRRKRW